MGSHRGFRRLWGFCWPTMKDMSISQAGWDRWIRGSVTFNGQHFGGSSFRIRLKTSSNSKKLKNSKPVGGRFLPPFPLTTQDQLPIRLAVSILLFCGWISFPRATLSDSTRNGWEQHAPTIPQDQVSRSMSRRRAPNEEPSSWKPAMTLQLSWGIGPDDLNWDSERVDRC